MNVIKLIKRNNEGITLIALVITILVLLILAGVAISMLSGENGILRQAASAKDDMAKASEFEAVKLAAMAGLTAGEGKIEGEEAFDALNKGLKEAGYDSDTNPINSLSAIITIGDNTYEITQNGEVTRKSNENNNDGEIETGPITFSVDGVSYTIDRQMTWEEFINSGNPANLTIFTSPYHGVGGKTGCGLWRFYT